jgi:hypothetical protein
LLLVLIFLLLLVLLLSLLVLLLLLRLLRVLLGGRWWGLHVLVLPVVVVHVWSGIRALSPHGNLPMRQPPISNISLLGRSVFAC